MKVATKMQIKQCPKCKQHLPLTDFVKHSGYKDGLSWGCKSCHNQWNTERFNRRKQMVFDAYGCECHFCGESNPIFLTIDHINGDGKQHRQRCHNNRAIYADIIKEGCPKDKYRLLCFNCNCALAIYGQDAVCEAVEIRIFGCKL